MTAPSPLVPPPAADEASLTTLLTRLPEQLSDLVRAELELARNEMTEKARHAGLGAGLFSVAGLLGVSAYVGLLVTVTLLLALAIPGWAATLAVTVTLLLAGGASFLVGRSHVKQGIPPIPEQAVAGVRQDLSAVSTASKEAHRHAR